MYGKGYDMVDIDELIQYYNNFTHNYFVPVRYIIQNISYHLLLCSSICNCGSHY